MTYDAGTKNRAKTDYLAVHCSASPPTLDIGAKEIDKWHRQRGFKCIGYHFVIRRNGKIEEGRPIEQIGAHVEGWNEVSVGICLVGGVDANDINKAEDDFTVEQKTTLKELLIRLKEKYPKAIIQGHRDFPNVHKACPSFDVKSWLKTVGL